MRSKGLLSACLLIPLERFIMMIVPADRTLRRMAGQRFKQVRGAFAGGVSITMIVPPQHCGAWRAALRAGEGGVVLQRAVLVSLLRESCFFIPRIALCKPHLHYLQYHDPSTAS